MHISNESYILNDLFIFQMIIVNCLFLNSFYTLVHTSGNIVNRKYKSLFRCYPDWLYRAILK